MSFRELFEGADLPTRRQFLGGAGRTLLGVGAMPLFSSLARGRDGGLAPFAGRTGTARNVIYLFMSGGMSHLDTFDLKPGSDTQGPTVAIPTNVDGVVLSEHFRGLSRQMDKAVLINSLQTTQGAHAEGRYYMHTSYEMRGTIKHPSLGAWLLRFQGKENPALPGHVAVGNGAGMATAGFLESKYLPLPIGAPAQGLQNCTRDADVTPEALDRRLDRLGRLNDAFAARYDQKSVRAYGDMYQEAVRLMGSKELTAFDIGAESEDAKRAYGDDPFGQGCLLARRLIEHDVRFVEVVSGGWDTHNQNFDALEEKVPTLDRALSALLVDLETRGLLDDTLVVVATEFGRTPTITRDNLGRNHYPQAFSCLLAGGGVLGGRRYGRTDEKGERVIENPVTVPDFNATIAHALGLPLEQEILSPSGRPFTVAHKGKPVTALFA